MSSTNPNKQEQRLYDYHKYNLVYIGDYIKFADGKAGVALGVTLFMIGFFGKRPKRTVLIVYPFGILAY